MVADSSGRADCGRLIDGIAGSNHAEGLGVLLCVLRAMEVAASEMS